MAAILIAVKSINFDNTWFANWIGVYQCGELAKGQEVPFANPKKSFGAQDSMAVGWAFFWLLFFVQTKNSNSLVGARTDIKIASQIEPYLIV